MTHLCPWFTRVFLAVCYCADRGPVTVRSVARRLGIGVNAVWVPLKALKDQGFVTWEPKKGGTIRPLYRVEMFQ